MRLITRKLCRFLLIFLTDCIRFHSVSYLGTSFSSIDHLLLCLCAVFDSISSNIDEVLCWSTHLLFLSLETLTSIIRTGLPTLVELIDLVNSVIIFLPQMTFTLMVNFPDCDSLSRLWFLLFWIYLFLLTLVFVLQWLSLHWEILIVLLFQFPSNS